MKHGTWGVCQVLNWAENWTFVKYKRCRIYKWANCDSDHMLVRAKIRNRTAGKGKKVREARKEYNIESFKWPSSKEEYSNKIREWIAQVQRVNVAERWRETKSTVKDRAAEVLGETKKEKGNDNGTLWWGVQMAVKERTCARDWMKHRATRANVAEFR